MKIFTGRVISTKMAKTATVLVERVVPHPVYKKPVRRMKKYQVHDENSVAVVGQIVQFSDSKPYSKLKRWALVLENNKESKKKPVQKKVVEAPKKVSGKKVEAKKTVKKGVKAEKSSK